MGNPIIFARPCPLLLKIYDEANPKDTDGWVYCEETTEMDGPKFRITGWVRCRKEWVEYMEHTMKADL